MLTIKRNIKFLMIILLLFYFNNALADSPFSPPLSGYSVSGGGGFIPNRYVEWSGGSSRSAHLATDCVSSTGNWNVLPIYPGTVIETHSTLTGAAGRYVIIQHQINGTIFFSEYQHLASISVSTGQSVNTGTVIGVAGRSGTTDTSYDRHLHYEIFTGRCDPWAPVQYSYTYNQEYDGPVTAEGTTYYNPDRVIKGLSVIAGTEGNYGTLDVNGFLDGISVYHTYGYLTFDVYINGSLVADDTGDYWNPKLVEGSSYEIKDIKPFSGFTYNGTHLGSLTGTIVSGTTTVELISNTTAGTGRSKEAATSWAESGITGNDNIKGTINGYDYTNTDVTLSYLVFDAYQIKRVVSPTDFVASNIIEILNNEDAGTQNMAEGWNKAPRGSILVWKRADVDEQGLDVSFIGIARGDGTMVTAMTEYGVTDSRIWFFNNRQTQNQGYVYQGWGFFKGYNFDYGTQRGTLDVNGLLDGESTGSTGGYGTFDVYINGQQVKNDVGDYNESIAAGTNYEIKDIKALSGKIYKGLASGSASLSGTITAGNTTNVRLKFNSLGILNVDGLLDGTTSDNTTNYGTFDVYINGTLLADDVTDYWNEGLEGGTSYEIKDIKVVSGKVYKGLASGSASLIGTITAGNRIDIKLEFESAKRTLEVKGFLDGVSSDNIAGFGTFDVYINGNLADDDVSDYVNSTMVTGTTYEISDIKAYKGFTYKGVHSGALSGTIGSDNLSIELEFSTNDSSGRSSEDATSWAESGISGDDNIKGTINGYDYSDSVTTLSYLVFDAYGIKRVVVPTDFVASDIIEILNTEDAGSTSLPEGWNKAPRGAILIWKRLVDNQYVSFIGIARGDGTMVTAITDYGVTDSRIWYFNNFQSQNHDFVYQGYGFFKGYDFEYGTLVDNEAPVITSVEITSIKSESYTLTCYATDNVGITKASYQSWIQENSKNIYPDIYPETISTQWSFSVTVPIAIHGNKLNTWYSTRIYVYDQAGNSANYNGENSVVYIPQIQYSENKLTLPDGVIEISDSAFEGASAIEEVILPDGLITIGSRSFANCNGLRVVHVPETVTTIQTEAFSGSNNVVLLCGSNSVAANYSQQNGIAYLYEKGQ